MGKYKKCPRCELNYILSESEMCDVCRAQLGLDSKLTLLDDIIEEEDSLKLCPICKVAYISDDEDLCESCLSIREREAAEDLAKEDENWVPYEDIEDGGEDDVEMPLDELEEEYSDESEFEDEENQVVELDDYEDFDDFDDLDDLDDLDDDDLDDDDDL